ncbi:PAS domain-containing protein [Bernardetia sp. ABR2-2B]|uniref:PAS domain-containing protein n=1 Tax=Bernardetia sp. ABR2-2B TaxID=3127472 RepID=UPI0030D47C87
MSSNTQRYILGGFLFGLLFPLFSWILDGLFFNQMDLSWDMVAQLHTQNPIHFVIDSAPFVLAAAFGTIGFYINRLKESDLLRHSNLENYNQENKKVIKRMRIANTIFPILISIMLVIGFLVLQDFSNKEQDDVYLIELAGKQRSLSQKILYHTNKIPFAVPYQKEKYSDSLYLDLNNLKEDNKHLIKSISKLEENYYNPRVIQNLLQSLQKSQQNIIKKSNLLLDTAFSIQNADSLALQSQANQILADLENNQYLFSSVTKSIITIYQEETKGKFTRLKIIQFVVISTIIIFIIGLSLFGLKPIIDRVKQAFFDVEEVNSKFLSKNETLETSQEELKINSEELRAINDNLVSAQKEIEQKQDLLNRAEKMAKMGSFFWNLKTQIINHSDNLPSIYRLEKGKAVTSETFREIVHSDDYEINQEQLAKAAHKQKKELLTHYRARPPHLPKEEDWKHYRAFSVITYNDAGEPILLVGTAQDVTKEIKQNKKVEILFKNLQKNKERLEESQILAKIVSYDMDVGSDKIEWSDSFKTIFNVDKENIPTSLSDFRNWIYPQDLERIKQKWEDAINSHGRFNEIYKLQIPNKGMVYIKEKAFPSFDENEKFIGKWGTLQDITKTEISRLNSEQKSLQIRQQNENFLSSMNYAKRIQSALLGNANDLKSIFKDSFIYFAPKDIVSGDFYWYAEVEQRKIIIVADCTGHGVPGAFMSLLGITLLTEIVKHHKITTPSEILNELQKEITDILKQKRTGNKDGMDISIAVIDEDLKILEFAGAKNPLVYIHKKRGGDTQEENMTVIKGDALSIGGRNKKIEANKYTNHVINLDDVEVFYLYSDGYQDQFGGTNKRKFMSKHFRSLLYKTYTEDSMSIQRKALKTNLRDWMGRGQKQIDDICVIGITV